MNGRIFTESATTGYVIILLTLLLASCTVKNRGKNDSSEGTQSEAAQDISVPFETASLQGVWWSDPDDIHALFNIVGDSLYYTDEQDAPYHIKLEDKNLVLSRDSVQFAFEVRKLTADSLIVYDQILHEAVKFYKSTVP